MGDAIEAFNLFTTESETVAEELAKKLDAANRQRKASAGAITRAVHDRLAERSEIRSVIALGDPLWRPALLGLVANGVADEYERPVFLWGREGNNTIKGSMRSGGSVHALNLMEASGDAFAQFGGHAAAGGFTVAEHAIFDLEDRLVAAHAKISGDQETKDSLSLHADAVLTPEEIHLRYLSQIEKLAPYGMQNPKPIFLLRDVLVKEVAQFGKGKEHLKLTISSTARDVQAIVFFAKGALARSINALAPNTRVNLLAHLERDTFSRTNPVRLRLLNLKPA
jgi:single-stranded-DNA-specific exonuclease